MAGLTFEAIANAIGKDEVWVAAAFYGQVRSLSRWCLAELAMFSLQAKLDPDDLIKLAEVLGIPSVNIQDEIGAHWWPHRGLGPAVPTDPVIYRLYEVG
jgi:cyanate lyase